MSDELSRLKSALRTTSPRPPAAAREQAISEAMAAFERHHQGSGEEARHKGRTPMRGTSWIRRLAMPLSHPSLAFAGGAAVVVVAGIVSHQVMMTPVAPLAPDAPTASAEHTDAVPEPGGPDHGGSTPAPQPTPVEIADLAPPDQPIPPGGVSPPAAPVASAEGAAAVPALLSKAMPGPMHRRSMPLGDETPMRVEQVRPMKIEQARRMAEARMRVEQAAVSTPPSTVATRRGQAPERLFRDCAQCPEMAAAPARGSMVDSKDMTAACTACDEGSAPAATAATRLSCERWNT